MSCRLTMTVVSECQEGNIGEDWKYDLDVKVHSGELQGQGSVSVAKHNLPSGIVRDPHGSPAPQVLLTGECTDELVLRIRLVATEVDLFVNDVGEVQTELVMACPGPAGGTLTKELDLDVQVRELPQILPRKAVFTLRVRFNLACA